VSHDTLFMVLLIGPFAVLGVMFWVVEGLGGNPLSVIGRAKIRRKRALNKRQAELIARGYHEYAAKNMAESELQTEAATTTRMLRDAGVES